jgi:cytochrome P450
MRFSEGATLVHSTRDHDEVRRESGIALAEFDRDFMQPSLLRRRRLLDRFATGELVEDDLPKDVLTLLLRNEEELALTPEQMRREVAFYVQAGSHSTANAFTHAMDDLFGWFGEHPEERAHACDDTLFLQRCIHESIRLNPASPVAWRRAVDEAEIGNCPVPRDGKVVFDLRAGNRDREVFGADADVFNPYRELPPGVPPWGQSFGGGMHACIGMELDAGVWPGPKDGAEHVYGTLTLMVKAMLDHGARPDPDNPPRRDETSVRPNYASYPVLLGGT